MKNLIFRTPLNNKKEFGALSNEAKGRFGAKMTRNKSNEVAPYVVGGLAATVAAPFLIGEAAPFIADVAMPTIGNAASAVGRTLMKPIDAAADAFAESSFGQKAIPFFNTYLSKPINATFAAEGVKEFVGPNGFQKTANHFTNGEYGESVMSGIGDAVNLGLSALGGRELMDIGRGVVNSVKGSINNVRNYLTRGKPAKPIITADNAAMMTDAQWDVAYNNAVKANDMAEAQRLRDLHFKTKAPNTKYEGVLYRGTDETSPIMDISKMQAHDVPAIYTTPYEKYAAQYGDNVRSMYANIDNPWIDEFGKDYSFIATDKLLAKISRLEKKGDYERANKYKEIYNLTKDTDAAYRYKIDGVNGDLTKIYNGLPPEILVKNENALKYTNPITYDDAGNIIPLSQRDNFAVNDLRYAFKPNSSMAVEPMEFEAFNDVPVIKTDLPKYAQNPSKENLVKAPEILDERFSYRDWIERMEGRKISDKEFEQLRKQYPANQVVIEDSNLAWEDSYVPRHGNTNEAHIGKRGTHELEIENTIIGHEKDHAYGVPKFSEDAIKSMFGHIPYQYLKGDNGAEMFARLGQIANWYGIKNIAKQPLTGDMLKYAAYKGNYLKDANFDNNMADFFHVLQMNNSWDSAAEAFNKYGKVLIAPMLFYSTIDSEKK